MKPFITAAYRSRTLFLASAVIATLVWIAVDLTLLRGVDVSTGIRLSISLLAVFVLVLVSALSVIGPRVLPRSPVELVHSPVTGRWTGLNSPASSVPSHGTRAYGQAYAIDLVHEPDNPGSRPEFGGPVFRAAEEYPAFGEPVLAMVDGTVVGVSSSHRDHAARSNMLGLMYMMVEGIFRSIGGPRYVIGNHVMIRTVGGVFATVAHLQRNSVTVEVGDRVQAGEQIGRCGNSGNSSEPHVHAQLADRSSFWSAEGIAVAFRGITLTGERSYAPVDGLPENGETMTLYPATSASREEEQ